MKKFFLPLLVGACACGLFVAHAAGLPEGALELSADGARSQTINSPTDNGSFSVTFTLDADALKKALGGARTQLVDAHLNAGRKPQTDVGYAIQGGNVYYTYIQYFADQFSPLVNEGGTLEAFVKGEGNLDSITGGVITLVHATYHNKDGAAFGSHYYLDLHTTAGVKRFTGYTERLKISDRKLGTVSLPAESPARKGVLYADHALTDAQAGEANEELRSKN